MNEVFLGALAIFSSITAPLLLLWLQARERLTERREDWARQDETAKKLDAITEQGATIHALVNSDMTAARQAELANTELLVIAQRKIIALDQEAARAASPEEIAAIGAAEARIAALKTIVAERKAQAPGGTSDDGPRQS
jgi:hypothetical protein